MFHVHSTKHMKRNIDYDAVTRDRLLFSFQINAVCTRLNTVCSIAHS